VPFGGKYRSSISFFVQLRQLGRLRAVCPGPIQSPVTDRTSAQPWRLGGCRTTSSSLSPRRWVGRDVVPGHGRCRVPKPEPAARLRSGHGRHLWSDHILPAWTSRRCCVRAGAPADITVAALPVPVSQASSFGIIAQRPDGRIVRFEEKPSSPTPMPGDPTRSSPPWQLPLHA